MKNNAIKIICILFSIVIYSCNNNKLYKNDKIELSENDYEIINITKTEMTFYENRIQINLEIKIVNNNKSIIIKNTVDPIINIKISNKNYIAKGLYVLSSFFPDDCDYCFTIDENKKIMFFENNIIGLLGFEEIEKLENTK